MYVEIINNSYLTDSNKLMAVRIISASWAQNVCSYFLDKVYVEVIKYFHLADSNEIMAVRVICIYWAQKRLIPTF